MKSERGLPCPDFLEQYTVAPPLTQPDATRNRLCLSRTPGSNFAFAQPDACVMNGEMGILRMNLEGKNCIITGAASGIGRAIARRYHAAGARLAG